METEYFTIKMNFRLSPELLAMMTEMKRLYPKKYQTDSQLIRAAVIKIHRAEVIDIYGNIRKDKS